MYKLLLLLILCASAIAEPVKKSPVDLLREGRMIEAQRILEMSDAPERYNLLLDALREPNAIEACFLYREISARFPGTDCDEFAQERLLQAASMGIDISALVLEAAPAAPPGEWPEATSDAYEVERPLIASTNRDEISKVTTPEVLPVAEPIAIAQPKPAVVQPVTTPKIESPVVSKLVEDAKPKTQPAESATLDYSAAVPAKKDTGIVVASLTGNPPQPPKPEKKADKPKGVKANPEVTKPHDIDAKSPDGWYIQVGAFGNHDNARKLATKLHTDGYNTFLVTHENLLQVRVGAYDDRVEARTIGDNIKAKYNVPAVLVTVP